MTARVWIPGAADPEMEAIEALLRECGETVVHAVGPDGHRVHPGNAYRASLSEPVTADVVYEVECMVADRALLVAPRCITIDHHRPGDPGHGKPPGEFMAASSLGQVIAELARLGALPRAWRHMRPGQCSSLDCGVGAFWLRPDSRSSSRNSDGEYDTRGWRLAHDVVTADGAFTRVPHNLVLTAAADHCLGAAYRGQCPGVDPDTLMRFRAEQRAAFQSRTEPGVTADVILSRIAETQAALKAAPEVLLTTWQDDIDKYGQRCDWSGGYPVDFEDRPITVRDMRRETPWPELPEAATRLGIGYISGPLVGPDGRHKYTVSGDVDQVHAWMDIWAPANGLVDIYGDPARGFAGGYLSSQGRGLGC